MLAIRNWRTVLWATAAGCFAMPALAQHVLFNAPGLLEQKKAAPPTPPSEHALVWPRLDPGAVICSTEDDLDRHAANMIARVSGGETQSADCRAITQAVGVKILSRQGPGRTQVQLSAPGNATGWTDVWLPDRAPPSQ